MICIPSGNHDMVRIRKYLDNEELKLVYAFLLSMPGAPFIYYGDEIGMRYLDIPNVEGGYHRTGSRTPMQWNHGINYGFSEAPVEKLYTVQDTTEDAPAAADQMADENSLWHEIQRLAEIRREHPALCASGKIEFVYCEKEKYPLVYLRYDEEQKVLVALNPSGEEASCPCPYKEKAVVYSRGGAIRLEDGILHIPGESAAFVEVE